MSGDFSRSCCSSFRVADVAGSWTEVSLEIAPDSLLGVAAVIRSPGVERESSESMKESLRDLLFLELFFFLVLDIISLFRSGGDSW